VFLLSQLMNKKPNGMKYSALLMINIPIQFPN
jgi:hypothetical protein